MDDAATLLVIGAIAGTAFVLRRTGNVPRRASWDVPSLQRQHAERLAEAAALYRAGRTQDAKILLRDRALDWDLIQRAAAAQTLDPAARRIAQALRRDGIGMFLDELHRLAEPDRADTLTTLIRALNDYTGPAESQKGQS